LAVMTVICYEGFENYLKSGPRLETGINSSPSLKWTQRKYFTLSIT
jgi:hypothetical protein